jgi:hypothetical protein
MHMNTSMAPVKLGLVALAGVAGGVGLTALDAMAQRGQTATAKAEYPRAKQYIADSNANFNATLHGKGDHAKWLVENPAAPGVNFEMGDNETEGQGKAYLALQDHTMANLGAIMGGTLLGGAGLALSGCAANGAFHNKIGEAVSFATAGLGVALFAGGMYEAFSNPDQRSIVQQIDPGSQIPMS